MDMVASRVQAEGAAHPLFIGDVGMHEVNDVVTRFFWKLPVWA